MSTESLITLVKFTYFFRSLNICGGDFYSDGLIDLLEEIGSQLICLELYYVDQIDLKVLKMENF